MEENVNEVLGVSENTTTEAPKEVEVQKVDKSAEVTLLTIATIVLWCGIIASVICLVTLCFIEVPKPGYHYITEHKFNPAGFATTIMVLFSSLISWGVLKVLANISITLKSINSKMK